ncbi:hypothetical protein NHQ30_005756 [Ciborinia camelliae]|nr:hypothetical protein NHQ30_005756 [Ciborinia camelliae]
MGLWELAESRQYATSPEGHEDTSPIDVLSLKSDLEVGTASIENARRRRVKKIMDRARDIPHLKTEELRPAKRPGMLDRAVFESRTVSTLRFLFCVS